MRNVNKALITLCLIVFMLIGVSTTVFATGDTIATGDGTGTGSTVNGGSDIAKAKSGYLVYTVSTNGAVTSDVVFVPYLSRFSSSVNSDYLATRNGVHYNGTYIGNISSATNGEFNQAPYDLYGYAYGDSLKNWLLQMGADGKYNWTLFTNNVLGTQSALKITQGHILCIEAVTWTPMRWQGQVYAYTDRWGSLLYSFNGSYSLVDRHIRLRLPTCGYVDQQWTTTPYNSVLSYVSGLNMSSQNSNDYIDASALQQQRNGFGVIMLRSVAVDTPEEPTPEPEGTPVASSSDDYLMANELNYIFPDLVNDTEYMRTADQVVNTLWAGNPSVWQLHSGTLENSRWRAIRTLTGDSPNFYSNLNYLMYRSSAGEWGSPDTSPLSFAQNTVAYPSYAYMTSRNLFGDDMVICAYKNTNLSSFSNFLTNYLGYSIGYTASAGIPSSYLNREFQLDVTKQDNYTFSGEANELWTETLYDYDVSGNVIGHHTITHNDVRADSSTISYDITHGIFKYIPFATSSSVPDSSGTSIYTSTVGDATPRVVFSSDTGGSIGVAPEVPYVLNYNENDNYNTPSTTTVYCMGDEVRTTPQLTLRGYRVGFTSGGSLTGTTLVDTALDGTSAIEFSTDWGNTGTNTLQVAAQGSGFETATTGNVQVTYTSFMLDLYDEDVGFGCIPSTMMSSYSTGASLVSLPGHNSFVSSIQDHLTTDITMRVFGGRNESNQVGTSVSMQYDITPIKRVDFETEQIRIRISNGVINPVDRAVLITKISSAYGVSTTQAEMIMSSWGLEQCIDDMLVSSSDEDNNSGMTYSVGSTQENWYDEQTDCLCITIDKTIVTFGNVIFNDKNDYGSSASQLLESAQTNGRSGVEVKFYFTLKLDSPAVTFDGHTFSGGYSQYLLDEANIDGANFLISNVTTSDWSR